MAAPLEGEQPPDAAAAAMNGNDTIVLQASTLSPGLRIKRLKMDHAPTDPPASYHAFQNGHAIAPPARRASLPDPKPPSAQPTNRGKSLSREATQTPKSPLGDARTDGPVLRKTKVPSLRLRLSQAPDLETQSLKITSATKRRHFDFRAAPSDPSDFAWWIAQQVRQAYPPEHHSNDREALLPGFGAMTSVMRPLEAPPVDEDPEVAKEKEREKQRLDNRERKKRWREINAERNKDNDLRCRVTKLARNKYGEYDSEEKLAFIEREFETRRMKRAIKEKRNATYRGTVSAFRPGATSSKDLKESLRASLKDISKKSVEIATAQLIEIVVDAAGQQFGEESLEMAQALQKAIASGAMDAESVEEAARLLAASEDLKRALEEGLERKESDEPENASGEGEDQGAHTNGHGTDEGAAVNGTSSRESPEVAKRPTDRTGNLNAAVQTLNGIGRGKSASATGPGRRKKESARVEKPRSTTRRKGKKLHRLNTKSAATDRAVDTTSIDALLALANGGSIFNIDDDDDDETVADAEEVVSEDLNFMNATTDEALNDVLERVAARIVRERGEREAHAGSASTDEADRTRAVREQVLKMKAFVSEAGVGVNTLVPSTEAQALSELYAQLRKYIERERTPQEEGSSLFRTTGWTGFGTQPSESQRPPSSHRSSDEQRNIQAYGFPPLPGQTFVPR